MQPSCAHVLQELKTEHTFKNLRPSMAANLGGPFPKLKSKAAETRHLGKALHRVWQDYEDNTLQEHRMISRVLRLSWQLEEFIDERFQLHSFSTDDSDTFVKMTCEYNACLTWLGNHYHQKPDEHGRFFNYVVKNHYLQHAAWLTRYLHPARTWCYQARLWKRFTRHGLESAGATLHPCSPNHALWAVFQNRPGRVVVVARKTLDCSLHALGQAEGGGAQRVHAEISAWVRMQLAHSRTLAPA